jgi:hypothetical protein
MGSARVSRVGLGVAPKQSYKHRRGVYCGIPGRVREREEPLARTRDVCVTQTRGRPAHTAIPPHKYRTAMRTASPLVT